MTKDIIMAIWLTFSSIFIWFKGTKATVKYIKANKLNLAALYISIDIFVICCYLLGMTNFIYKTKLY